MIPNKAIPKQLQNYDFRFIIVSPKSKRPYEVAWTLNDEDYEQNNDKTWTHKETGEKYIVTIKKKRQEYRGELRNYRYDSPVLNHFLDSGYNYGVMTGYGNLAVLDDDTENFELIKRFEDNFGKSFMVRGHYYIKIKNWDKRKIIFNHSEKKYKDSNGNLTTHMGELQGKGLQAVAPNSIHPSGERYEIKQDIPIKEVEWEDFKEVFKDLMAKEKKTFERSQIKDSDGKIRGGLDELNISDIVSTAGFTEVKNGVVGSHPAHGSTNGKNFFVSNDDKTWTCFRCNQGKGSHVGCGDVWSLIAVVHGIIDCSQAGKQCLSPEQSWEVFKIAKEKYGVEDKSEFKFKNKEPKGWAKSINIKQFAKDKDMTKCPYCNNDFEFIEQTGYFRCSNCRIFGGLNKFANLLYYKDKMSLQEFRAKFVIKYE